MADEPRRGNVEEDPVNEEDAAMREPIVTNLGTPAHPILAGDLPVHGFEYQEILLTCPPVQEEED